MNAPAYPYKGITIAVSEADIENGIPNNPAHCPVAVALQRLLQRDDVSVTGPTVHIGEHLTYKLPTAAKDFIAEFDSGNYAYARAFSFDLTDEITID